LAFLGIGMMDEDLEPCPYHIQTSMGASKKTRGLTKINILV
jgi:hypothetical protein